MRTTLRASSTGAARAGWEVGMDPESGTSGSSPDALGDDPRAWTADQAVTVLHAAHYRSLVRTAALLLRRTDLAEEVVQDAFVGLHRRWGRLRDPEQAAAYLRQSTVNGARSVGRRAATATRKQPVLEAAPSSVPDPAAAVAERDAVLRALATLPERQREVLFLRYYADLDYEQIAETLEISVGTVGATLNQAHTSIKRRLEEVPA
jgi:RNA polymerase sigma-70 factor (sigma-E family)